MDTKRDIPHREMGEQDDELLEQLWKQLPDSQENPFIDQQVSFNCVAGDIKVAQVDASAFAAWKDGWIYFEDETLPDLAKRLSRVYGVEIKVAERLKNYSFSGKISYERGVDYITRLMAETNGVVCEVENGVLWLR